MNTLTHCVASADAIVTEAPILRPCDVRWFRHEWGRDTCIPLRRGDATVARTHLNEGRVERGVILDPAEVAQYERWGQLLKANAVVSVRNLQESA